MISNPIFLAFFRNRTTISIFQASGKIKKTRNYLPTLANHRFPNNPLIDSSPFSWDNFLNGRKAIFRTRSISLDDLDLRTDGLMVQLAVRHIWRRIVQTGQLVYRIQDHCSNIPVDNEYSWSKGAVFFFSEWPYMPYPFFRVSSSTTFHDEILFESAYRLFDSLMNRYINGLGTTQTFSQERLPIWTTTLNIRWSCYDIG